MKYAEVLIQLIYRLPLWTVGMLMAFGLMIWSAAAHYSVKDPARFRRFRIINTVLFVISVFAIAWITIFSRREAPFTGFIYMPFAQVKNHPGQMEAFRALVMNAFLFFPFGLMLPFIINSGMKIQRRALIWTVVLAFIFSLSMEYVQFVLRIGLSEVDDILFNTIGALIGTFAARIGLADSSGGSGRIKQGI